MAFALSLALAMASRSKLARIAMTAMTTNSSMRVKAERSAGRELLATGGNTFTGLAFESVRISLIVSPRPFGCQANMAARENSVGLTLFVFGLDLFDRDVTNNGS